MNWSHIMYLPVLATLFWPIAIIAKKKHPTRAQLLLIVDMLMVAFATFILTVILRGRSDHLFIYQYILQIVSVLCIPFYYLSICALTEPRGTSLRQRRSLILPLLYIIGITIASLLIGPQRYETLCRTLRCGNLMLSHGDTAWNLMTFFSREIYLALIVVLNLILLIMASHKSIIFQKRFNSYYADQIGAPKLKSRILSVLTWVFLPLALAALIAVYYHPPFYKYIIISLAILATVLQLFIGRYAYSLDYDARYLAQFVKKNG